MFRFLPCPDLMSRLGLAYQSFSVGVVCSFIKEVKNEKKVFDSLFWTDVLR